MITKDGKTAGAKSDAGFTLVEVLIAMAILSLGMLAISSMQINSTAYNQTAIEHTRLSTVAVDQMEKLLQIAWQQTDEKAGTGFYDPLLAQTPDPASPHEASASDEARYAIGKYTYDISWTVMDGDIDNTPNGDFKIVTVKVRMLQANSSDVKIYTLQNIVPRIIG